MDTGDRSRGSTQNSEEIRQSWQAHLQDYVEGTLDDKVALRMHLDAQRIPELQSDIDQTRRLFAALAAAPVAQPSADFDAPILASIPLEHYASAPRRSPMVLLLGDPEESLTMRGLGWAQRVCLLLVAVDLVAMVLGRSPLSAPLATVGDWIGSGLDRLAQVVSGVVGLDPVAGGLAAGYDALRLSIANAATGGVSVVWLLALLSLALAATGLRRIQHRREALRGAEG